MNIKINFKNKALYFILVIVFIWFYFLFFINKSDNSIFTAEDLKIKTINSKEDFENILVNNIYDKIYKSCKTKNYIETTWSVDFLNFENSSNIIKWSNQSIKSRSVKSSTILKEYSENYDSSVDFKTKSIWFDWTQINKNTSFSQTNIQKKYVDEWDILKQTKDYIFYFSKKTSKIHIIKSPFNWNILDIKNIKPVYTIDIPSNLTLNSELFVNDEKLIYLASKKVYNNDNTIVWIYDISRLKEQKVELFKIFETKWKYFKSRLIGNDLYLISDYSLDQLKNRFCSIINDKKSYWFWEFVSFFTWIKFKWFWLNKELLEELKTELETFSYKFNKKDFIKNWTSKKLTKFKLFYTNKDLKESIENLNFNIVSTINIDSTTKEDNQVILFGNLKNWEIHMTLDNLYLVNSYFQKEKLKCNYVDICYREFASNNFTSISKISYDNQNLEYKKTTIIPWKPINQYSMDEDEWYFRIFTANWTQNVNASLYVFNEWMKLVWEIENIKPNEQFKSSRFIWNKAFLVTFRKKDPLFVIDLQNPYEPKIIWELHIPWYSSYLHPYWKVNDKEYLIWLWQENRNVKVDLYEIDYNKKTIWNKISVTQKYKYIFNWTSSESPSELNPRSFVWDRDEKNIYLPIKISNRFDDTKECNNDEPWCYSYFVNNSTGVKDYKRLAKDFVWLMVLKITTNDGITKIQSSEVNNTDIDNARVWYYKSNWNKISFFINNESISFFDQNKKWKIINF